MVLPLLSPAPDILFIIDRSIVFSPAFPFLSFIYCQLFTVPPEECFPSGQCCKQRRDHSQDQNTGNDACRYSLCLCTSEIHFLLRPPKWIECRSALTSQMLRIRDYGGQRRFAPCPPRKKDYELPGEQAPRSARNPFSGVLVINVDYKCKQISLQDWGGL